MAAPAASDPRTRKIKIKTGVVRRLAREEASYVAEARQQEARIERMRAVASGRQDDNDECDIRKQEEVLQESHMMIPDCRRRLAAAHYDLLVALEGAEEDHPDLAQCQEFRDARSILEAVKMMEEEEEDGEEEEGGNLVVEDSVMMKEGMVRAGSDDRREL